MKVLLYDLDLIKQRRAFPNLALMKLSSYHKSKGDSVYFNFPLVQADLIYASCVFTWNNKDKERLPENTIYGGAGIDLKSELPYEVEHIKPDYFLYPSCDFSLGFTSRGCIRKCPWCIVNEKEGFVRPHASIFEFYDPHFEKIVLLDNNLLASPNWKETLQDIAFLPVEVDFNQGLDIRLLNEENIYYLKQVKFRQLRFAFDDTRYERAVKQGIELLLKNGINKRKLSFYVLIGFGEDGFIERMKILQRYNVDVFPMIYKGNGKEPSLNVSWGDDIFWHGARNNLRKFLRLAGRL